MIAARTLGQRAGLLLLSLALLVACDASGADAGAPATAPPAPTATPGRPVAAAPTAPLTAAATATAVRPPAPTAAAAQDATHYPVVVQIDPANHHPISPLIYGVADAGSAHESWLRWLGATLVRWGGNARTRFNWEINASNAGADWEFRNVSQGDAVPGSASLGFMQRNGRVAAASLLTIPTIGWVARDGNNDHQSLNVPLHGGPPVIPGSDTAFTNVLNDQWGTPYDPASNRALTSVPSFPRKGRPFQFPPDLTDNRVYQDEWVAYLRSKRPAGAAAPIYAMDNEPELWSDNTHVDVHPVRPGYDDALTTFLTYARAVKDADPAGLIAGPESWGVTGYLYSALDAGTDRFRTAADRAAHGNLPWLAWFLKSVQADDAATGQRSLDILSVRYYPNTDAYGGGNAPATQNRRMQAPRALWDGLYVEPSWVARTEWGNLALLPRLRKLIAQYYPGTRLGIGEWNYGGENDISGAIATADALGIYGRENVYYATYWQAPPQNSPSGWAFRLFRNYDGQGAAFGGESVDTQSNADTTLSAYSALDAGGTHLTVLLINKDRDRSANVTVQPGTFAARPAAREYRYGPANLQAIVPAPLAVADPTAIRVTVPPLSMSLVVLDRAP